MGKKSFTHRFNIGEQVNTKHGRLEIIEQIRVKNAKGYVYKCLMCGYEGEINEYNLKSGRGCRNCAPRGKHGKTKGELNLKGNIYGKNIYEALPEVAKLFLNIEESKLYTKSSRVEVKFKCNKCGGIQTKKISTVCYSGFSCDYCSDGVSQGEKFIGNILSKSKYKYYIHYRNFEWCKNIIHENKKLSGNKEYDFYIPELKMIIEVHGKQHYEHCSFHNIKGARTLEEERENDYLKQSLALNNGIEKYIVIDYRVNSYSYLLQQYKTNLEMFFLMSEKVISDCYKNSSNSLMLECCELYNQGDSVLEISSLLNCSQDVVKKYLERGTEIGISCYIRPPREVSNYNNPNSKKVRNKITGMEYRSISEASRKTGIDRGKIGRSINNKDSEWERCD